MIKCPVSYCGYAGATQEEVDDHVLHMDRFNLHESQTSGDPRPFCIGCYQIPDQIEEYQPAMTESSLSPDEYVKQEEGTYNPENGHFLCTKCYIAAGIPTSPSGWKAP